jgi:heme exporter protein A
VLEVRSVAAFRGDHLVFSDLSFRLEAGGALVLIGRNGSGKTTLLRLVAGLMPRAAGEVLWAGEDALADPWAAARLSGPSGCAETRAHGG